MKNRLKGEAKLALVAKIENQAETIFTTSSQDTHIYAPTAATQL
jgi:hypothetical protein